MRESFIFPLPVYILIIDNELSVIEASGVMLNLFKLRMPADDLDLVRSEIYASVKKEDDLSGKIQNAISKLKAPGMNDQFRWQSNDRTYQITVSSFYRANKLLFTVFFEDRTEDLAITYINERVRGYLESIMTSLHLGVIVTDRNLNVTSMNRAQEKCFKAMGRVVSILDIIGQPLLEWLPDENSLIEQIRHDVLDTGFVIGGIRESYDSLGTETTFEISFSPLRATSGKIFGIIRLCEDVTDKDNLEKELQKAEKQRAEAEAMRKAIASLNHEINNALLPIMANAEMLLRNYASINTGEKEMLCDIVAKAGKIADVTKLLAETGPNPMRKHDD